MPDTSKTVDAVLIPIGYPPGKHGPERAVAISKEFGPMLGCTRVQCTFRMDNTILGTRVPPTTQTRGEHLYHASDHPLAGQHRYDWHDRGDGVQIGLFNDQATDADRARIEAERAKSRTQRITEKSTADAARMAELKAIAPDARTAAQGIELATLERFASVMGFGQEAPSHAD